MRAIQWLKHFLTLPETAGLDVDDPRVTNLRVQVIRRKGFLRRLYLEWYELLRQVSEQAPDGPQIELGSGGGFLKELLPRVITSEVAPMGAIQSVFSAQSLPFRDRSLSAIFLVDVLHHLPRPKMFFAEARRCLKPGGRVAMIEPYSSPWGRWVYRSLHHEPFDPNGAWELDGAGPLSTANGALPWIIFVRDRPRFDAEFPELRVVRLEPMMPFSYLISGGVSLRSLAPACAYPLCRALERALAPWKKTLSMFAYIELQRSP